MAKTPRLVLGAYGELSLEPKQYVELTVPGWSLGGSQEGIPVTPEPWSTETLRFVG